MDAKKNKMYKVRLRRLRPDMVDKLKTIKVIPKDEILHSSSLSDSDNEDMKFERINIQLKSSLPIGINKDCVPNDLSTETQTALQLASEENVNNSLIASEGKMGAKYSTNNANNKTATIMNIVQSNKKPKHCKRQKSNYASLEEAIDGGSNNMRLTPSTESDINDLIYNNSDDEEPCEYNCNNGETLPTAAILPLAPSGRSSSSSGSSSPLSDQCSVGVSKLFKNNYISVIDDENPPVALSKILSIKEFDPLAPQQILEITIKPIVSLADLRQRMMGLSAKSTEEGKKYSPNFYMDIPNIVVNHSDDEFLTYCLCENCEKHREFVIHIMVEQFNSTHMVVMLLDVLIKSYIPMLQNITAYNKFEKLLENNKVIYWITCGVIYHKKTEHLDFIYDEYLSDNMIFVLFSSILMLNNPLLLLQILAFHVECVVKAYAEGFLEIVEPDKSKIPANEMINYILNGYDDLMRISEQVSSYLFAFENNFLRKFSLTWKLLCQRLYQQHVHLHLADTMLACIITLKEEELTSHHTDLIKRYIQFDDIMNYVEKRWTDVWIELNKFNLSDMERKRRNSILGVYRIFDAVVQDAIQFSLQDSVGDGDFCDFRFLKNRRLAWKNMMSYTKMKWPDGFFQPPNTLVVDDKCQTCNISLEYHIEYCKCITCSIAGGPLPPRRNADAKCSKCLAHEIVEKDVNFYDSKILNVCTNDDFQNFVAKINNGSKHKSTARQHVNKELYSTLASVEEMLNISDSDISSESTISINNNYHISWAVFSHLNNRKRYPHETIAEKYFCRDCKLPSCILARKILNNKISPSLSQDLVQYFQPVSMSREELRSILPNIMLYNRKLVATNNGLDLIDVHDLVVKIYWIFIISIYAIYFTDDVKDESGADSSKFGTGYGNGDNSVRKHKSSVLDVLEVVNNDIKVNMEKIIGNKDDTKFLEFIDKVKSLSPYNKDVGSNFAVGVNVNSAEMQKRINDVLKIADNKDISTQRDNISTPIMTPAEDKEQNQTPDLIPINTVDAQVNKSCKVKQKKCCLDHSDMGDHYKENHSNKKRLKKDCNHARMNETRDRLRKKLSQIINARKNTNSLQISQNPQATTANCSETENQLENISNPVELKLIQDLKQFQHLPLTAQMVAAFEYIDREFKYNEDLYNFSKTLPLYQSISKNETKTNNNKNNKKVQHNHLQHQLQQEHEQQQQQQHNGSQLPQLKHSSLPMEPPTKKSNLSNNSTRDASISSQGTKSKDNNSTNTTSISSSKTANNLDFVSEICEIIDNYSKEQAKRKWIKETLSFIEGPKNSGGKKKMQPQTLNPKKAAKKAKQKQRKEEEKRIAELHDLRAQFHNIYFKEFSEKLNLKSLKAIKKGDKKKIAELENNIKNLQRAKSKVETAILELIATVKQTNSEFKFPYLPTKEQQMEKMKELEGHKFCKDTDKTIKVRNLLHHTAKEHNTVSSSSPFPTTTVNNLNIVPESYSMPYAHANHFPYNLGFSTPAASAPFGLLRAAPICYAPSSTTTISSVQQQYHHHHQQQQHQCHHQQLTPDVLATMSANATNSSITDPSKRIVTIRRVNLPNVPEPQVTVTAKGPSPDKDKLLYTFINGQLIQTGMAPPINIPQMPTLTPLRHQQKQSQSQQHISASSSAAQIRTKKLTAENLLTMPPPPTPKLSKTQMKKERKRMAKLQAEAEAAKEAERKQRDDEQEKLRELKQHKQLELQQNQQPKKKNKNSPMLEQQAQLSNKNSSNKKKKNNICSSNSTTSISTNENHESPQLAHMMGIKSSKKQKRSNSTTTSCSAATSTSSNNSTSSQMNTRDNSVSSLKPIDLKISGNVESEHIVETTQKLNSCNKNKTKNIIQIKQTRTTPTPSITSSDTEDDEQQELKENKLSALPYKSQKQSRITKLDPLLNKLNKQKKVPQKSKSVQKSTTPQSSDCEREENAVSPVPLHKEQKKRRPKLIDNGQFDNNPFKSLHMQDSGTEWSSAEEDENEETESEVEIEIKKKSAVKHKNKPEEQRTNIKSCVQIQQKKFETETKQIKSQNLTTTPSKCSKSEKYKHQDEKCDQSISTKCNNATKSQQKTKEDESNANSNLMKQTSQQKNCSSNRRKTKTDSGQTNSTNNLNLQSKTNNKQLTTSSNVRSSNSTGSTNSIKATINKSQTKNSSSDLGKGALSCHQTNVDQNKNNFKHSQQSLYGNMDSKNQTTRRSQRNKKYQQKSQKLSSNTHHQSCCSSGIPHHMGYFNANEVNISSPHSQQQLATATNTTTITTTTTTTTTTTATNNSNNNNNNNNNNSKGIQNHSYPSLVEQMQTLRLNGHQVQSTATTATAQQRQQHINSANVSIMDQLNRGVQVENLSLPPGITLTKVDPAKSEQLRQKSESIKKLAKPLQQHQQQQTQHHQQLHHVTQNSQAFHHSAASIIAPPVVNPMTSYYGSSYVSATAGIDPQSGIIMVEANPPKSLNISNTIVPTTTSTCNSKQSKNKKRRNKSKATNVITCSTSNSGKTNQENSSAIIDCGQPKMITLRNPMFHNGPTAAAATTLLQQPALFPGRSVDGFPLPAPLPIDQPAAIIKNENGMYTIRNPALHQAVTSGLAIGGYRQFGGNVNYYTPQEAAAEAARATRQLQKQQQSEDKSSINSENNPQSSSTFSYFSNDTVQTNTPLNNISISCTSIGTGELNIQNNASGNGGLTGDAVVIQRPASQHRPISAIGSEIKSAQQQKQKTKVEQQQWSNFGSDSLPLNKSDNLSCNASFLGIVNESANLVVGSGGGVVSVNDLSLQEKYQKSKYYNGFDVFTGSSGGSSSSGVTCAHIHHSCGDDSPPPSITGYNSYLEGIPNTGVIRYDDASFLKNLIPGQNLNNEVSIHNVNDSNFGRNSQSPQAHRVEITPVYTSGQTNNKNFRGSYRDSLNNYNNDTTIFPNSNLHLNLNELETSMKYDYDSAAPTSVASVTSDNSHNTILDFKDLLIKNGSTGPTSHRTSPYLDENTLEDFVQNMNSLQIANTSTEEQSSKLNGSGHCVGHETTATSSANSSNSWW